MCIFTEYKNSQILQWHKRGSFKKDRRDKIICKVEPMNQFILSWTQSRWSCGIGRPAPDYLTAQRVKGH